MMRLLAWAAWACAEAAGVAFVERIVSAYAPNVAAIFAADANGDGRIERASEHGSSLGLTSMRRLKRTAPRSSPWTATTCPSTASCGPCASR